MDYAENINIILVAKQESSTQQHSTFVVDVLNDLLQLTFTTHALVNFWLESELTKKQLMSFDNSTFNLILSFGGDGTMIYSMKLASVIDGHVIGVNCGTLGFLTSYEECSTQQICNIVTDYVKFICAEKSANTLDPRYYLNVNVNSYTYKAVNEVLLVSSDRNIPLMVDTYVNGTYAMTNKGDGVMISTATGSTAYALSAGGSIMDPNSKSMQIVPLASHSLSSRPIIVDSNKRVMLSVPSKQRATDVDVVIDGQTVYTAPISTFGLILRGKINQSPINIVRPTDWDFYYTLKRKLHW